VSQAIGVDGQLIGAAFNIKRSFQQRRWFGVGGYFLLTVVLGYVAFLAAQTYILHESQGVAISQTLALLGVDPAWWALQRAMLIVVLVILSGLLRYTAPKEQAQDEATRLRQEITLAPLRAQAQAAKALGVRTVVQAMVKGEVAPTTQPLIVAADPTDPYPDETETPSGEIPAIHILGRTPRKRATRRAPRGSLNWEAAARNAWQNGAHTIRDMEEAVPGIKHTAAQHWVGVFRGEERGEERARREA
jgi:hypothetical protein